jgi:hypothetical protein
MIHWLEPIFNSAVHDQLRRVEKGEFKPEEKHELAEWLVPAHRRVSEALRPSTHKEIEKMLDHLALGIGVHPPADDRLTLYIKALEYMGNGPLKNAFVLVVRTHRWPKMPLPADIIAMGDEQQRILVVLEDRLAKAIAKLN